MRRSDQTDITQTLGFGMLITTAGGFMDTYSYTVRGQVFATGQTGNIVLVALRLLRGEYLHMVQTLVPILASFLGMFAAEHLLHRVLAEDNLRWRRYVLMLELALLFLVGWIPGTVPHMLANTLISVTAAMQFCCFRNLGQGAAYATIFCTGNLRSCAEMYYRGLVLRDRASLKKAHCYGGVLGAFFLGACLGIWTSGFFAEKSIWCACGMLAVALAVMVWGQRTR